MNFTDEQKSIIQTIIAVGQRRGAPYRHIRAALAAGYVESRFRNLNYGDRDSLGVFQQRPSQGWGTPAQVQDVEYAANKFYEAAARVKDTGLTPGQLAQKVQRSAFPLRYDQALPITDALLSGPLISADVQIGRGGVSGGARINAPLLLIAGLALIVILR